VSTHEGKGVREKENEKENESEVEDREVIVWGL
jgi:hypothetical protein